MLAFALALLAAPALAGPAFAGNAGEPTIEVTGAWARATPPRPPIGGAYLSIRNRGEAPDRLVGADSPVAKTAELHAHVRNGEVLSMVALADVEIRPGQTVEFAPGGLHVMLMGLSAPLKAGSVFPLTLRFAKAGAVTVEVAVRPIGAAGPEAMAPDGMVHDPAMHQQHMADPAHREMHESMHGPGQ
ncbi:copper chaperone PCu(A)C [Magnetospirillum sp. UT-4]|uniref:copper chaperone PCu(A)C n=1 Tax=Magnetospirillum sp. UT-4 TaxID=2681467 RepID=UPI001574CA3C|nr:copper chaperone PCu(A)C [Magnetospirillum sp. UT-4]